MSVKREGDKVYITTKITYIYALTDDNGVVRYVGKSDSPLARLHRHLIDVQDTHKVRWINSLRCNGAIPLLKILQVVEFSNWQQAERNWIDHFKSLGFILTNSTDGGKGPLCPSKETRFKMRMAKVGKKQTLEHRKKVSDALKGIPKPPRTSEHSRKLGLAHIGRKCTFEEIEQRVKKRRGITAKNKIGLKGVYFDKSRNKFQALITINNKTVHLGRHVTAHDAALAYNVAAISRGCPEEGLNKI